MIRPKERAKSFCGVAKSTGRRPLLRIACALLAIAFLGAIRLHPAPANPTEYEVKAAYLYNFGRFIEWPADSPLSKTNSFLYCVLGQDPFGPALDSILAGETVQGKSAAAKRISRPEDALDCHVLFVSASEEPHLKGILDTIDSKGVVTVSDIPGFSRRGGMIQFVSEGDRIRFEVNLTVAQDARLTLRSELLKVAAAVRKTRSSVD